MGRRRLTESATRLLLAAAIAVSLAIAAVWLVRVPIFGEPDENTHADYALTLWSAGRPISAAEHPLGTDVAPETRALARAGDFDTVRFDAAGHVEPGYGSAAYWRAVDAAAPKDRGWYARATAVPYVASDYPLGFYAVEALVFGAVHAISGSLVGSFFAMRAFCLATLAILLAASYGIFREMRLPRGQALALVVAIGWFPTVDWSFAYVQPDDLAAVLFQLALLVTLRMRRLGPSGGRVAALGLTIAALAAAKLHIAIAIAAAVAVPVFFSLRRANANPRALAASLAVLVLPAIAVTVATGTLERHPPALHDYAHFADRFAAEPPGELVREGTATTLLTLQSLYGGNAEIEYYRDFSWMFTQISFGSETFGALIDALIRAGTLVAIVLVLARTSRALRVAFRVAKTRSIGRAVALAFHDPVWNAYVAYIGVLVVAEIYVDARVHIQGRYLVPAVAGAVLCAARYAPRGLPARFRRPATTIAIATLVAYSAVGSAFGLAALQSRFYGPPDPALDEYGIELQHLHVRGPGGDDLTKVARGSILEGDGWAFDSHRTRVVRVTASLDGRVAVPVRNGLFAEDEIDHLNDTRLAHGGFRFAIDTTRLAPGAHEVELSAVEDGRSVPSADPPIRFVLTASTAGG